jgi:hypothetical protein
MSHTDSCEMLLGFYVMSEFDSYLLLSQLVGESVNNTANS